MNLNYILVESSLKPASVEIQKTTVYFRKDFAEQKRTDELGNTCVLWTYQEATMSVEEFNTYANKLISINAVKAVNDSENILQLVENGSDSNNNQLILMEAIADLYDVIASTM